MEATLEDGDILVTFEWSGEADRGGRCPVRHEPVDPRHARRGFACPRNSQNVVATLPSREGHWSEAAGSRPPREAPHGPTGPSPRSPSPPPGDGSRSACCACLALARSWNVGRGPGAYAASPASPNLGSRAARDPSRPAARLLRAAGPHRWLCAPGRCGSSVGERGPMSGCSPRHAGSPWGGTRNSRSAHALHGAVGVAGRERPRHVQVGDGVVLRPSPPVAHRVRPAARAGRFVSVSPLSEDGGGPGVLEECPDAQFADHDLTGDIAEPEAVVAGEATHRDESGLGVHSARLGDGALGLLDDGPAGEGVLQLGV